jgi:hypothetical protein
MWDPSGRRSLGRNRGEETFVGLEVVSADVFAKPA